MEDSDRRVSRKINRSTKVIRGTTTVSLLKQVPEVTTSEQLKPLYFGTNRAWSVSPDGTHTEFKTKFTNDLTVGSVTILIPKGHKRGTLSNFFGTNKLRRIQTDIMEQNNFLAALAKEIGTNSDRTLICWIHGYYNSFESAAVRAAQLSVDIGFAGVTTFYSWPSQASMSGYVDDQTNAENSAKCLSTFLQHISHISGIEKVFIVAHSMGNFALMHALDFLSKNDTKNFASFPVNEFVLAAADISVKDFNTKKDLFSGASRRTLYINERDYALNASSSGLINGLYRVGHTLEEREQYDVIDAGSVSSFGHSYIADSVAVMDDLRNLLHGTNINSRTTCKKHSTKENVYEIVTK